jgi:xanthine dehydrogenase accessory factor
MHHDYELLLKRISARESTALAVLLKTSGSVPQEPGAAALFSRKGLISGTIGGGILEATVEIKARRALKTKQPLVFDFRLDEEPSAEEGALCGGEVTVLIDPTPERDRAAWLSMERSREARRPGLLATHLLQHKNGQTEVRRYWLAGPASAGLKLPAPLASFRKDIQASWRAGRIRFVESPAGSLFIEPRTPLPRLIIAGAGHIGQAVSRLGTALDFEVTVIDDRPEYANAKQFPQANRIIVRDIGQAVGETPLGTDAYLVIVTRGHTRDAEALRAAVRRPSAYMGMIGSLRKVRLMRRLFLERGWATARQWARVHTPIGLPIGSRTVAEIAVSIAAELVKVRREQSR